MTAAQHRFPVVACSACGETFGPGDHGFSHCGNHAGRRPTDDVHPTAHVTHYPAKASSHQQPAGNLS